MNVLLESLVGAGAVTKGSVLKEETYGSGSSKGAGPSFGLELVSGDTSCEQLLAGHTVVVETGAWREIESPDLYVQTFAESFPSVDDAITVMDENNAEALNCTTMKVRVNDEVVRATHEVTMRGEADGVLLTLEHQIVLDYGGGNVANILMVESRQGGEVFTLAMTARTSAGARQGPAVEQKALTRFTAAMKAYRADHPRTDA